MRHVDSHELGVKQGSRVGWSLAISSCTADAGTEHLKDSYGPKAAPTLPSNTDLSEHTQAIHEGMQQGPSIEWGPLDNIL